MRRRAWMSAVLGGAIGIGAAAQEPSPPPPPKGKPDPPAGFNDPLPLPVPRKLGPPDLQKLRPLAPLPKPTVAGPLSGTPQAQGDQPLTLGEVLSSIDGSYPALLAALQERAIADGRRLQALGAFDTNLRILSQNQPEATFENYRFAVGVDQAFTHTGLTAFTRYRTGYGDFPSYNGGQKTADGGELSGGVILPLLRDSDIDRRRANLAQAAIDRALVEPNIERQRLDIQRIGGRVYWGWVASGQRFRVARELLRLASERDAQLEERVKQGFGRQIDRVDNRQNVALRAGLLASAEQAFQQAAVDLSLFLRDRAGASVLPPASRVPEFGTPVPVEAAGLPLALEVAFANRPELVRVRFQRDRLLVELRFAENQLLPALNLYATGSQDFGLGKPSTGPSRLDRASLDTGLELQVPVQRSFARGSVIATRGQLAALGQQERLAIDTIRIDVQTAWTALDRVYEQYRQNEARVKLADEVAEAERTALAGGQSNVLLVVLRETAAFEARVSLINTLEAYYRALIDYRVALGIAGASVRGPDNP